jgi:predicted enzyme related to lactoylglutathione lyase
MSHVDRHAPGSFSWIELGTSDQTAAKAFYTTLLGWTFEDSPMGPGDFYTMFRIGGRNVAAAYTLREHERSMGVPPHWNLYITVAGANEIAEKAKELGGQVLAGPFDVFTHGRMAVIRDPTGPVFSIWEPKEHIGAGVVGEPGSLCWADVISPDPEAAAKFYTSLFGWTLTPGEGGYQHIKNGENFIGGIPPVHAVMPGVHPHWSSYIQVADIEAAVAKAQELGGGVCLPTMSVGSAGRMAVISDPQGAVVALFEVAHAG